MSRVDINVQVDLLKEVRAYFDNVEPLETLKVKKEKDEVVLTEEHIYEWLEVFYEDRIMMDTCNQAYVKR